MRDHRASDPTVDRAIRSWLREDRHEDVSRIAGAVLDQVDTTPQRRSQWWPARRTPDLNKFVALGLGAAAVVVALVIGTQMVGPSSDDVGSAASASPAPTGTAAPPESSGSTPPLTQSFTSAVHGISLSYPEGWTARPAIVPRTEGEGVAEFVNTGIDVLQHPVLGDHLFLAITSQTIGDATPEEWIAKEMTDWGCTATEPIVVGGASGLIGCNLTAVTIGGRGYWIALYASQDDPGAVAPYDRAWLQDVLATVALDPEDAVD